MIPFGAVGDEDVSSEDKPRRSRYISKKDLTIVAVIAVLVIPLLYYFWKGGQDDADDAYCKENLRQMGVALSQYLVDHDGRLPPTHNMAFDGGPALDPDHGLPVTWATIIHPHMSRRNEFWCRTTKKAEGMETLSGVEGKTSIPLSYGMYRGLSTVPKDQVVDPSGTVIIAESTNAGASDSYNPVPFGNNRPDGFLLGWDDGNLGFSRATQRITRLGFSNAKAGYDGNKVLGRHGARVNGITVEGNYRKLTPYETKVEHSAPRLKGLWWADPNLFK